MLQHVKNEKVRHLIQEEFYKLLKIYNIDTLNKELKIASKKNTIVKSKVL